MIGRCPIIHLNYHESGKNMDEQNQDSILGAISQFFLNFGFTPEMFLNQWVLIQIAIVLVIWLFARIFARNFGPMFKDRLRLIEGQRGLLRFLFIIYRHIFSLTMTLVLWSTVIIMRATTWPSRSYLLGAAASLFTAFVIISIASRIIKNRMFSRFVAYTIWGLTALSILGQFDNAIEFLDTTSIGLGNSSLSILAVLKSIALLILLIWLASVLSSVISRALEKNDDLSPSIKVLLSKLVRIGLFILAIVISLGAVGIDFTVFAVFSGAVGIGIGLGLQKIVSNFISGIILLLDKSIKPGDVIEIQTVSGSTYGWVQHLGARFTAVRTRDGTETLIPNETFIDTPVTNWTFTNKVVRRKLDVGVAYTTDVEEAIKQCVAAAEETGRILKVPKPTCLIKGFGDSSVDLQVRFWISDSEGGVSNVSSNLYLAIWKRFRKANIEIPFPQRDINVRSFVPFEKETK